MSSQNITRELLCPTRVSVLKYAPCVRRSNISRALTYKPGDHAQSTTARSQSHESQSSGSATSPSSPQSAFQRSTTSPSQSSPQPQVQLPKTKPKTIAERDEELRLKLEGISGEGGVSGIEYEGGKATGLKRGVKDNMFRVI